MLELTRWIGEHWLCPWGTVLQSVLPAGVRENAGTRMAVLLSISEKGVKALELRRREVQEAAEPLSYANFETIQDAKVRQAVEKTEIPRELRLTPTQEKILHTLMMWGKPLTTEELARRTNVSYGPVKLLRERGFIQSQQSRIRTGAGEHDAGEFTKQTDLVLNPEQNAAMVKIREALHARRAPRPILLHGVTGSGKTEVYVHAIREVVRAGRQAIVLVPEISLTPQTVQRFRSRFANIAVLHSHLTDAQRHDEWERILHGDVEVIVGARSAVFAPTPRLGLIVIDEEHETSFKQDSMAPRYHAREVAIQRGKMENALVLLGSATPSLESWHRAQCGEFELIPLVRRLKNRVLPHVSTVDLRIRDTISNGAIGRKM
ncbi:MAG: primosomal protein N', partial [Thermoguttaceae bacterium]|nr:primosomal protein N' [Thermoguttaceae bacterium]